MRWGSKPGERLSTKKANKTVNKTVDETVNCSQLWCMKLLSLIGTIVPIFGTFDVFSSLMIRL